MDFNSGRAGDCPVVFDDGICLTESFLYSLHRKSSCRKQVENGSKIAGLRRPHHFRAVSSPNLLRSSSVQCS